MSHHHSPEEDAFTARLVADLEAAGADVWVDTGQISSGNFIRKINEELTGRQWLVLVMTPAALQSGFVQDEVDAALLQVRHGRMLGVIPLVAHPWDDRDIPPLWATLHRYDAIHDYSAALNGLLHATGLSSPTAPPMPTDRFPARLASLGYEAQVINGVEVILPPMCSVPAGEFLMGHGCATTRPDDRAANQEPEHRVTLPDFAVARFPVTVAEYACFVKSGHPEPSRWEYEGQITDWKDSVQLSV